MIWIILLILCLMVALFLYPSLAKAPEDTASDAVLKELDASKDQLRQIEAEIASGFQDDDSAARAKRAMERRILTLSDQLQGLKNRDDKADIGVIKYGVIGAIILGTLLLYPVIGRPFLEPMSKADAEAAEIAELEALPEGELIARMEARLAEAETPDPVGYVILARAKLAQRDATGALAAYQNALDASDGDDRIAAEMTRVKAALETIEQARPPALDQETVDAFGALSDDERAAQIQAMVDSLAARLEDNPDDLQGWMRLIRARSVMGDQEAAQTALATARATFGTQGEKLASLEALATELNLSISE